MKKIAATVLAFAALITGTASTAAVQMYHGKRVFEIHVDTTRPCVLFRLDGITDADPANPGSPWFAVLRTHGAYDELFAMLLSAKVSNRNISIWTDGITTAADACGTFAKVNFLFLD